LKFLIIGDSWALGEWRPQGQNREITLTPNTSVAWHLKQAGHKVCNLGASSAGNFGQLRFCNSFLQSESHWDYIVWLQTEPIRDVTDIVFKDIDGDQQFPDFAKYKDFDQAMHYVNTQNYRYAQQMFDSFAIPFIVVGGLGKLSQTIAQFDFCCFAIDSWASEILKIPDLAHNLLNRSGDIETIHRCNFEKNSVITAMNQSLQYQEAMRDSDSFPDSGHPDGDQHQWLAEQILEYVGKI